MIKWTVEKFNTVERGAAVNLLDELMADLREQDYRDLTVGGMDAHFLLLASIDITEEGYIYRDEAGKLLCVLGVSKANDSIGRSMWMVGTKHLQELSYIKCLLIKESKKVIDRWVSRYGLVYNCVNRENTKSIRWLTWLGAHFLFKQANANDWIFIPFYIDGRGD